DDIFCLRIFVFPPLRCFFQSRSPFFLSTHHKNRSSPSATLRKMRSFQMIGVAPVQLGIAIFQVTFSSALHFVGRFFSALMPLRKGPRHCGQLSANAVPKTTKTTASGTRTRLLTSISSKVECHILVHSSGKKKARRRRVQGSEFRVQSSGFEVRT